MKLKLPILLFFIFNFSYGQFFKKLGDKAQEAAERVLERKTEERVEQSTAATVDSIFEAPKKIKNNSKKNKSETDHTNQPESLGTLFSESGETNYASNYVFSVTATIEMEDVTTNVQKTTLKQGYGKEALLTEMDKKGDPIIIDMKNQSVIMLNIASGTAQIMSLEWMQKMMGNESISTEEASEVIPAVMKTGKTKVMHGYTCHEYTITFTNGRINAWYATDVKFDYQDYLRGMAKLFSKKREENPMQLLNTDYGYVMEMTYFNKESTKQNSMKVVALEEKVRMIDMDLFKIQKL